MGNSPHQVEAVHGNANILNFPRHGSGGQHGNHPVFKPVVIHARHQLGQHALGAARIQGSNEVKNPYGNNAHYKPPFCSHA